MRNDQLIPNDELAERAFVGGIIFKENSPLDDLPEISLDLFWHPGVRLTMQSILDLRAKGMPHTLVDVGQYMQAHHAKTAPADGGWPYFLSKLLEDGGFNFSLYLSELQNALSLRRLYNLHVWLGSQFGPGTNAETVIAESSRRLLDAEVTGGHVDHDLPDTVAKMLADMDSIAAGNAPRLLKTPLAVWNEAFGGLPAGSYLALGGRPGLGKSSMMEQIVYFLLADEIPVLVFEKDMSLEMLLYRLACRIVGVPYWKWNKKCVTRQERDSIRSAVAYFPETRLRLHNPVGLTADQFASIVRREKRQHGVQAVFLDQIQLLKTGDAETVEGLTRASMTIKASAHDTDIPHVVLFQVNRNAPKGVRPKPEHVKGFDQLLSDVDGMAMLWSEQEIADLEKGEKLDVKFYTAKNRSGGETEQSVYFDGPLLTFCNGQGDHAHRFVPEPATRPVTAEDFQ